MPNPTGGSSAPFVPSTPSTPSAALDLSILYRGTLSSCNYDCPYCPFAKHWESPAELKADREGLRRFCDWAAARHRDRLAIFFTPWGEALVRGWYRQAVVALSQMAHVTKVAVQTNLSCKLDWLREANVAKVGLWCTYHPGQTTLTDFAGQCRQLDQLGAPYSVGCVGLREHWAEIEQLRQALPGSTYVWVNAYKSDPDHYDEPLRQALEAVDPLFPLNNTRHASLGRACRTGHTVITVDSRGDVRRCHFVDQVIGNIHDPAFEQALRPRPCPNVSCGCHIGYVHLEHLQLEQVFGSGLLERIPASVARGQSQAASPERPRRLTEMADEQT